MENSSSFSLSRFLAFPIFKAAAIVAAVGFVFEPIMRAGWLWDDPLEITKNPVLRDPSGLWKIWFAPAGLDYFPLKTTVQWVQWHLWHDQPAGYHATNVVLHLLSAFLLWRLLEKLGVGAAWLGGLIFAIHPLVVESVAWISELKNVLSLPLVLMAMIRWVDFDASSRNDSGSQNLTIDNPVASLGTATEPRLISACYILSLLCFLAAMLCKSSVVMFPVILLLYAWWRRGRVTWRDCRLTAPFFAVSLALGLVTIWFQHHRAIADLGLPLNGFLPHLAVAGIAIAFYFFKCVLPVGLLPIYPRWAVDTPTLWQFWPLVAMGGVALWLLHRKIPWSRHVFFGAGCFFVNLLPVLGFIPMAYMRISWVADHLVYLPLVGLVGLAAAGLGSVFNRVARARIHLRDAPPRQAHALLLFAVSALTLALAFQSRCYAAIFESEKTLWTYELRRNSEAWIGYNNLGMALGAEGKDREAIALYEKALQLSPNLAEAHNNLGNALAGAGRSTESIAHYERAIQLRPDFADPYNNEGNLLMKLGRVDAAIEHFKQALRIDPNFAEAHSDLGNGFFQTGRFDEAILQYKEALRLSPDLPEAQNGWGAALAGKDRLSEAVVHYEEAIRLRPDFADAHNNLGVALARMGRVREAIAQYQDALRCQPDFSAARDNLELAEKSKNLKVEKAGN